MNVYFISGLGADERVFQFLDLPGINKTYIKWVIPIKNETLKAYSIRLSEQINSQEELILIGISFGGIIAQELSKILTCKQVIIISSIKSPQELSLPLLLVRATRIYKLFPARFLKCSNLFTADYYFSTASKEESVLLHQIIKDTDNTFMVWAIDQLMKWKNTEVPRNLLHIHGERDRIFPIYPIRNVILIKNGGHFMIVNKAKQVSQIIIEAISKLSLPDDKPYNQ